MCVIRGHYGQGDLNSFVAEFSLVSQYIIAIIVHEPFSGQKFKWNGHFDTWVAQSFAQTTCYQYECSVVELFKSDSFIVLDDLRLIKMKIDTIGLTNVIIFIWVN